MCHRQKNRCPQLDRMSGLAPAHVRHKPEQTLLYHLVERYWPEFQTQRSETGRFLPRHATREFEDYLACGRLENGFLRVRCESCSQEHLASACDQLLYPKVFAGDSRSFANLGHCCHGSGNQLASQQTVLHISSD
ncbi:MAG: hypothetical protein ACI9US_003342 [Gammaproteobacteria bacterium]|jgi:hypothetical protein